MALQVNITNQQGAIFNYWKLNNVQINQKMKNCVISIDGYVSKDAFLSDSNKCTNLIKICVNKIIPNFETVVNQDGISQINALPPTIQNDFDTYFCAISLSLLNVNPQKQVYMYLKSLPEFAGAVDIDLDL